MGTELYARHVFTNRSYDEVCLSTPKLVSAIHEDYVKAGATLTQILLTEQDNVLTLEIVDDGCGMSQDVVRSVIDPFYTTRTTRKVGMGIPLLKLACEQTGGTLTISSVTQEDNPDDHGTHVTATLHTDHIDIVELHCVTSPKWPDELARHMEALARAKKAGKIRAHGCSFHSYSALEAAVDCPWVEVAHVRMNPFGRSMSSHPDRVLAKAREFHAAGKGVVAMKVLGVGTLKDRPGGFDRSLRWNLESGVADVLNIGFTSLAEIDDIIRRIGEVA
jgi:hypothetical protein